MEVYDDDNSLFELPQPFDNSLTVKGFVECFSARSKYSIKSVINKYTFSYANTYLCVASSGSHFRVIGRLFHSKCDVVKHCADFDVYKVGTLQECIDFWRECVRSELLDTFLL